MIDKLIVAIWGFLYYFEIVRTPPYWFKRPQKWVVTKLSKHDPEALNGLIDGSGPFRYCDRQGNKHWYRNPFLGIAVWVLSASGRVR